jgi:hypothetical protein
MVWNQNQISGILWDKKLKIKGVNLGSILALPAIITSSSNQ